MSQNLTFSFELAHQLYTSVERFPVDFDLAWVWLEYSRKDSAKRLLEKNFVEGEDYTVEKEIRRVNGNNGGGAISSEKICLTIACFERLRQIKEHKSRCNYSEKAIIKRIASEEDGQTEVIIPAGKIDVLTSTELIEVKKMTNWKEGIGQLLVYSYYYPSHTKRLHLFGRYHSAFLAMVESHTVRLNTIVTVE